MSTAIRDHLHPILGAILLVTSSVLLFVDFPGDWKLLHLVLFIGGWSVGLLLVWGVIGTHPLAAKARRVAGSSPRRDTLAHEPVTPRLFRYGANRWRRGLAAVFIVALGLGMSAMGAVFAAAWHADPRWVGPAFGIACAIWGILSCDYARRYLRVGIGVDDEGIRARLYYHSTQIRWDEIVSLVNGKCTAPMLFAGIPVAVDAGTIYWVYSSEAKIWFSNGLGDSEVLVKIIAQRTGMTWEQV